MAKNNYLLCRGASITHIDQRVAEGNCFVRVHVQCDLTEQIVEKMGWESALDDGKLSEAVEKLELSGELNIDQISFTVNGQSAVSLECVATRAEAFKVSRIKGETEGVKVTVLRFLVISTAWKLLCEYFGMMGAATGVLRVDLQPEQQKLKEPDKQMQLGDDAPEEPETTEVDGETYLPSGKSRPGDLAPAAVVLGNRRPRALAMRKPDPTAEEVQ
jgi:hypothetical protein